MDLFASRVGPSEPSNAPLRFRGEGRRKRIEIDGENDGERERAGGRDNGNEGEKTIKR